MTHRGKALLDTMGHEQLAGIVAVRDFSAVSRTVKGNRIFTVWSVDFDNTGGLLKVWK